MTGPRRPALLSWLLLATRGFGRCDSPAGGVVSGERPVDTRQLAGQNGCLRRCWGLASKLLIINGILCGAREDGNDGRAIGLMQTSVWTDLYIRVTDGFRSDYDGLP